MVSLTMPTSGRRLAKEGAFTMGLRYTMNNVWMAIFRRPFTREAKEVRFGKEEGTVYRPANRFREGLIAVITIAVLLAVVAGIIFVIFLAGRAFFG